MYSNILSLVNGLVLPRLLTAMVHIHLFISYVCGTCVYIQVGINYVYCHCGHQG